MPIRLAINQPVDRFYRGGSQISTFRDAPPTGSHTPEDWVASTTCCFGTAGVGMSRLPVDFAYPSGMDTLDIDNSESKNNSKASRHGTAGPLLLADEVASQPEYWLGPRHVRTYGRDTKLLVKLLDAGQRLPVHAHPHRDWAKQHVGRSHGKAEAWYILTPGVVYLGLRETIEEADLLRAIEAQHVAETLLLQDKMHVVRVQPHDTVYVPPGVLHAIGEGILLVEVQEPEDLSILLEWKGFALDGERDGHLGVGFATALGAVERRGRASVDDLVFRGGPSRSGPVLAAGADEYFRLDRVVLASQSQPQLSSSSSYTGVEDDSTVASVEHIENLGETLALTDTTTTNPTTVDAQVVSRVVSSAGFAILVGLRGQTSVKTERGGETMLSKGTTLLVPYHDGEVTLEGDGELLIIRPPPLDP